MNCPVIQTSGGTSFIDGLEDRTFPYGFSDASIDAVVEVRPRASRSAPSWASRLHYGSWRHWAENEANRKWIYVEQDPTAIGVNRPIDVPLVGDLRAVVPQLVDALRGSPRQPSRDLDRWIKEDADRTGRTRGERADAAGRR